MSERPSLKDEPDLSLSSNEPNTSESVGDLSRGDCWAEGMFMGVTTATKHLKQEPCFKFSSFPLRV